MMTGFQDSDNVAPQQRLSPREINAGRFLEDDLQEPDGISGVQFIVVAVFPSVSCIGAIRTIEITFESQIMGEE
jgi:hypothetical protein